jgi:hypothetical protein
LEEKKECGGEEGRSNMSLESRHVLAYVSWVTGPLTWRKRKSEEERRGSNMSLESRHVLAYVSWVTGPLTWRKRKSEEEREKQYVAGI